MVKKNIIEPVIKWSGSKRLVAPILQFLIPPSQKYFEPFVGSGAMLPFKKTNHALAGDIIEELIVLWKKIKSEPEETAQEYESRWKLLQENGQEVYYKIRDNFNQTRNSYDFLFLTRTCVNGLTRFNKNNEFNNSFHLTRPGIEPKRLKKIIYQWSLYIKNIDFINTDYKDILLKTRKGDFVFLDPPYAGNKDRYLQNNFNFDEFYDQLEKLNKKRVKWMLTFDGKAGTREYNFSLPQTLFERKIFIKTGNSPFTKMMKSGIDSVLESVYLNYNPTIESIAKVSENILDENMNRFMDNMENATLFNDIKFDGNTNVKICNR